MPKIKTGTSGAHIISDDGATDVRFELEYDNIALSGLSFLMVNCYKGNTLIGTPIRFRMSDSADRIFADLPSVSNEHFQTDTNGKIEHG